MGGDIFEENQYLELMRDVLENGIIKKNRTKIDTISSIGKTMRFSLRDRSIPLLTTKKMFVKGIIHELIWFISGDTNVDYLNKNGVKIWDRNSKEFYSRIIKEKLLLSEKLNNYCSEIKNLSKILFGEKKIDKKKYSFIKNKIFVLEKKCFEINERIRKISKIKHGDLGPIYGAQWRNFNGQNCDQLSNAIEMIKSYPESRRIIVSAWNPLVLDTVALPPCHCFFQFFVEGDDLSCLMYQRSCDLFLGVPFNIASYSILTHLIASVTGKKAKEFIHVLGDAHIYFNHRKQAIKQLKRQPYPFPKIELNSKINSIFDFKFNDIKILGYKSHNSIKAEMVV